MAKTWREPCIILCCLFLVMISLFYSQRPNQTSVYGSVQKHYSLMNKFDLIDHEWNLNISGYPAHLMCDSFFRNDQYAIDRYKTIGRITLKEDPAIPMDCTSVLNRIVVRRTSKKQIKNNFAVARNIFTDYFMQETMLSFDFSYDNVYCFTIDNKSSPAFKERMQTLSQCLANVIISDKEYDFDSAGHYQDHGHYACIEQLVKYNWTYVLLLQNHDVILRTNEELSAIIDISEGAQIHGQEGPQTYRYDVKANWTAGTMGLFKEPLKKTKTQLDTFITVVKSLNQAFLSKPFALALTEQLNMKVIMDQFNLQKYYGVDEMLMATLSLAHHLGLPGQVSTVCLGTADIVRFEHWNYWNPYDCGSRSVRHGICILGVEYLERLAQSSEIIANKPMSTFDLGTTLCLRDLIRERSRAGRIVVNLDRYKKMPQVREMKLRNENKFNSTTFKC